MIKHVRGPYKLYIIFISSVGVTVSVNMFALVLSGVTQRLAHVLYIINVQPMISNILTYE